MEKPWNFIWSGALPGSLNMALDKVILEKVTEGMLPPTLRLYTWEKPCISLGHSQDPKRHLQGGIPEGHEAVRRYTGGRAVYHFRELTYSVCVRNEEYPWCARPETAYETLSLALLEALKENFPGIEMSRGVQKGGSRELFGPQQVVPCFVSTARSEITWKGRKLVGSAQRRNQSGFLQHGSIPLHPDYSRIEEFIRGRPDAKTREGGLSKYAVCGEEIVGHRITPTDLLPGFANRFFETLQVPFNEVKLGEDDVQLAVKSQGEFELGFELPSF